MNCTLTIERQISLKLTVWFDRYFQKRYESLRVMHCNMYLNIEELNSCWKQSPGYLSTLIIDHLTKYELPTLR